MSKPVIRKNGKAAETFTKWKKMIPAESEEKRVVKEKRRDLFPDRSKSFPINIFAKAIRLKETATNAAAANTGAGSQAQVPRVSDVIVGKGEYARQV